MKILVISDEESRVLSEFYETYDGETVVRYKCELTK